MKEYRTCSAETLSAWRAWLRSHHDKETEAWLILSKKESVRPSVSDRDAAEEALCWGWIDSLIKRVDDETYMKKFTPRTNTAKWSEFNVKRVKALIADGRMKPPGRAKIPDDVLRDGYVPYTHKDPAAFEVPAEFLRILAGAPAARANFEGFPLSAKKRYVGWIMSAKKEETRLVRMREAVPLIAKGKKYPMM